MRFYNKKQNIFFTLVLVFEFFFMSTFSVSAFSMPGIGGALPDPADILKDILKQLHMDQGSLQNQGEMMNVATNKGTAPEVSLSFSPSDPKEGEKLSAKAFPTYFSNDEKSLYYTWYLKHTGCNVAPYDQTKNPQPTPKQFADCNVDGDKEITVEDWKISAMKILVQNGYDPEPKPNYTNPPDDNDGYKASFGGDNKSGISKNKSYCYIHDNDSGVNYELGKAVDGMSVSEPRCEHLFPNASGHKTAQNEGGGTYSFGPDEEKFWGTNPEDPSTADNGNKDEANVAGLGQSSFTWSYVAGDQVGVAVEGTSMFPTKYDDSSSMIMWAFPNKKCQPDKDKRINPGTDGKTLVPQMNEDGYDSKLHIRGFDIEIPIVDMNLDDCIPDNLIDPTKGGQATNLSVSVSATPDNPVNDPGDDKSGDTVFVQANVDNTAQNSASILFDWKVSISNTIPEFTNGRSTVITSDLRDLGLLGSTKGNALDNIKLKLDIPKNKITSYLGAGVTSGYLKFQVIVKENFSGTTQRKGTSDVVVRFISSADSIVAYNVEAGLSGVTTKVSLATDPDGGKICFNKFNDSVGLLEKNVCPVIKNKIIGLKVPDPSHELSNFMWTINGSPLVCTARVSDYCAKGGSGNIDVEMQGDTNFFPATGNPGDTYTITMTANNVITGKTITLSRTFNIVEPKVVIESVDKTLVWPKFLGQYKDISGSSTCQGPTGYCDDLSESVYQSYSGSTLAFKATFMPGFLRDLPETKKEWSVDGITQPEVTVAGTQEIKFTADKSVSGIYNVNLLAQVVQSDNVRKALLDIWGISPFDSPEINFASSVQVEVQEVLTTEGPLSGPRKYYAAIASYIPASILFTFRIFLSVALTLFVLSLLNSLLEERRLEAFVRSFSRSRDK